MKAMDPTISALKDQHFRMKLTKDTTAYPCKSQIRWSIPSTQSIKLKPLSANASQAVIVFKERGCHVLKVHMEINQKLIRRSVQESVQQVRTALKGRLSH